MVELCLAAVMRDRPQWGLEGRDWPHRESSDFVEAAGLTWHVQRMGQGPVVLLAHGTGAATHSWRGLMPLLAERFTVIAPDLPGHGFTGAPHQGRLTLPYMARALGGLVNALEVRPALVAGHSAGVAILLRMCLDGAVDPKAVVSLNGALLPFDGFAGQVFGPIAKMLALNPLVPRFFAWRARDARTVERLIRGTGSHLDEAGLAYYGRLFRHAGHAAAALSMMSNWDLHPLQREFGHLRPELVLVAARNDSAIPPSQAESVSHMVRHGRVVPMPGLGHLAHEEDPAAVAAILVETARRHGVIAPD